MPEIHQQKRDVAENVRGADVVAELTPRPAVDEHDVAQVQIAVALRERA